METTDRVERVERVEKAGYTIKGIVLAQPVQYAGAMRTYFLTADGFDITRNAHGHFEVTCGKTTDYIELSFTNICTVTWQHTKAQS